MESNKIKLLILWDILQKNTDENHAMNADEIREELAKRGISVIRRVVANDIAALNDYGYEVLSYKKKYTYYYVVNRHYVVNRPLDTAEVVLTADALKSSKLTPRQKNELIGKLLNLLCCHQAESISKHLISFDGEKRSRSSITYNVDVIERAIDENKQVSFLYFDYNEKHEKVYRKTGGRHVMNPIIMVWDRNNYYMLCFSDNHDNIQKLYEDNVSGKISDERFAKMTATYETEQNGLQQTAQRLKNEISAVREEGESVDRFMKLVNKYSDITELNAEIIRTFVEKIIVYEAEKNDGVKTQKVKIVYNCVGNTDNEPVKTDKTKIIEVA